MGPVSRGARNAFRNSIRTFSIVFILGLSVALAISMMVARQAVEQKIESVKNSVGNTVTVTPAGIQGFQGGGEPLTTEQMTKLAAVPNVTTITQTLNDRATTETSNLVSAIEPGSFGNRQSGTTGVRLEAPPMPTQNGTSASSATTRTFTPPIIITGTNTINDTSLFGGSAPTYTSGGAFDATTTENVAVVGKSLATKNNLTVGSSFKLYDKEVKVVGIFETGNNFTDAGAILPIIALQNLSGQQGAVTSAVVTVSSIDAVDGAITAIETALGDTADITSNQESVAESIKPLESVKTISTLSMIGALVAGAVIILLTMTMIVRERRREIGVLKAIGASNRKTVTQFVAEAITLTSMALIVGLGIGIVAANPITNTLVTNSSSTSTASIEPQRGNPGALRRIGNTSTANIKNIETSIGVSVLAYGVLAALGIALVGSAIPAYAISKVRPADVMRAE